MPNRRIDRMTWRLDAAIKSFGGKKQIFGMKSQEQSSVLF
jgi:hypothetical protein